MSQCEDFNSILRQNSTEKYYIEYEDFLSNHMSMGLVALRRLGADVKHLQTFASCYRKKLENAALHNQTKPDAPGITATQVNDIKGHRKDYYVLLKYYKDLLRDKYESSVSDFVAVEFPKICDGMIGSALHGVLHLGYGLSTREDWFICEGMAYLHHSYAPLVTGESESHIQELGNGTMPFLDALDCIRQDDELKRFMAEESKHIGWTELDTTVFQRRVLTLFKYKGKELMNYASKVKFPDFFNMYIDDAEFTKQLSKWLIDNAIIAYTLSSPPNDFFMLHGVTSAWALKNILPYLAKQDVLLCTRCFLCALLATYMAEDSPVLDRTLLCEKERQSMSWKEILDKGFLLLNSGEESVQNEEEHIIKLIQVCREMSLEKNNGEMEHIYKQAAIIALNNPLFSVEEM